MNDKFEVEPFNLWLAGAVELPLAARQIALAGIEVDDTRAYQNWVFDRTDGCFDQTRAAWCELRDLVQGILRETVDNLTDTGTVLTRLASEYADTDASNAAELRLRAQIDENAANRGPVDQPPESVPAVPAPGVAPAPSNRRVV